jgi:hypothetical protein
MGAALSWAGDAPLPAPLPLAPAGHGADGPGHARKGIDLTPAGSRAWTQLKAILARAKEVEAASNERLPLLSRLFDGFERQVPTMIRWMAICEPLWPGTGGDQTTGTAAARRSTSGSACCPPTPSSPATWPWPQQQANGWRCEHGAWHTLQRLLPQPGQDRSLHARDALVEREGQPALAAGGLHYEPGSLEIRHLLDVIVNESGWRP